MAEMKMPQESDDRVFISYTRSDGAFALKLANDLRAKAIPAWIDQVDIPSGASWDVEVEQALRCARTVLVVLSPQACGRSNVLDEVSFAIEHHKKVVPVLHKECEIPLRLVRHQRVDFTSSYEDALGELIGDLMGNRHTDDVTSVAPSATSQSPREAGSRLSSRRGLITCGTVTILVLLVAGVRHLMLTERPDPMSSHPGSRANSASATPGVHRPEAGLALLSDYVAARDSRAQKRFTGEAWLVAAQDFAEKAKQPSLSADDRQSWLASEHFALGSAAESNGDAATARREFEASIQAHSHWALPHIGLAHTLIDLGDTDRALEQAQQAQVLAPQSWQAVTASAGVFVARRDFARAIEEFRRAAVISNDAPVVISALAFALHADGQHDAEAERVATKVLASDSDCVPAHLILAEVALERKQGKVALEHTELAVALSPRSSACWLAHGDALLLLGKRSSAEAAYQRVIAELRSTQSLVPPLARLQAVQEALARGELPPLRFELGRTSMRHSEPKLMPMRSHLVHPEDDEWRIH